MRSDWKSSKSKNSTTSKFEIKGRCINQFSNVKLFGIQVDKTLCWKPQCEIDVKNCSKALGLLYRFSNYIPTKVLKEVA